MQGYFLEAINKHSVCAAHRWRSHKDLHSKDLLRLLYHRVKPKSTKKQKANRNFPLTFCSLYFSFFKSYRTMEIPMDTMDKTSPMQEPYAPLTKL